MTTEKDIIIEILERSDAKDPIGFRLAFIQAARFLDYSDAELGELIGVSNPTIKRWKKGKSAPQRLMRRPVLDMILKEVKEVK